MAIFNGWRITRAGVVFVAGVIVLAALAFGGIYWVTQRGEQARREEAIAVAEENLREQAGPPAQEERSDEEANGGAVTPPDSADRESDDEADPAALPETGTELGTLLAVVVLALAGAYYLQSRRLARGL